MSYKIKSLLYFICFLISALVYNNLSSDTTSERELISTEKSKANIDALAENSGNEFLNIP